MAVVAAAVSRCRRCRSLMSMSLPQPHVDAVVAAAALYVDVATVAWVDVVFVAEWSCTTSKLLERKHFVVDQRCT